MLINDIYEKYFITPTLQLHQKRAAAVGLFVSQQWDTTIPLDTDTVVKTLLLHDMGNIIKFDLANRPELLGDELPRVEFWKQKQREFVEKYGPNEHHATFAIAREISVSERVQDLLERMGSTKMSQTQQEIDWELKLVSYADLRVGPFGVLKVNQRFDELIERYRGRNHPIADIERTEKNRLHCLTIEQQLQEHVRFPLEKITDAEIAPLLGEVSEYSL